MTYDPKKHHRRSIRLDDYNYSRPGAYFVTICTRDKQCLFGRVMGEAMQLNAVGRAAEKSWQEIPSHFPHVVLDEFVVMPNHVHGILMIVGPDGTLQIGIDEDSPMWPNDDPQIAPVDGPSVGATHASPLRGNADGPPNAPDVVEMPTGPKRRSVGAVIGSYKSAVSKRIRETVGPRDTPLWHRNYYEHIIRNDVALNRIRQYLADNPMHGPGTPTIRRRSIRPPTIPGGPIRADHDSSYRRGMPRLYHTNGLLLMYGRRMRRPYDHKWHSPPHVRVPYASHGHKRHCPHVRSPHYAWHSPAPCTGDACVAPTSAAEPRLTPSIPPATMVCSQGGARFAAPGRRTSPVGAKDHSPEFVLPRRPQRTRRWGDSGRVDCVHRLAPSHESRVTSHGRAALGRSLGGPGSRPGRQRSANARIRLSDARRFTHLQGEIRTTRFQKRGPRPQARPTSEKEIGKNRLTVHNQ